MNFQKLKQFVKGTHLYQYYIKMRLLRQSLSMLWIRFFLSVPCIHFRKFCLNSYKGVNIHKSVPIYHGLEWWKGKLVIGEGSSIGFNNHLDCRRGIAIGNNVCLATGVRIWTLHHDYNDEYFKTVEGGVNIEDYVWLCSYCIILPGVTIGEGAVVASGAVVCKDVEPWTVVGGVPAKVIGHREKKEYKYHPGDYWLPFM